MSEELITLDELELDDNTYTVSDNKVEIKDVHADQLLWKIKKLEKDIENLKARQEESVEFYNRRIDSVLNQIRFRANLLERHMQVELESSGTKTNKLPNGVLRLTTRKKKTFGDEDTLLKFSFENNIPTKVVEKPDKKAIYEHTIVMGDAPDVCSEEEITSFSYQTTNNLMEE